MKNNGLIWKIAGVFITVFVILASVAIAYGRLNQRVDDHTTKIEKLEKYAEDVIRLQQDIKYIKEAVDRIEKRDER